MALYLQNISSQPTGNKSKQFFLGNALPVLASLKHTPVLNTSSPVYTSVLPVPIGSYSVGDWVRVTGLTVDIARGVSVDDDTLIVPVDGYYEISVTALIAQTDSIARTLSMGITVNDKSASLPIGSVEVSSGGFSSDNLQYFNVSFEKELLLSKNDFISLFLNSIRTSGTIQNDYNIAAMTFSINRISGSFSAGDVPTPPIEFNPNFLVDATDSSTLVIGGSNEVVLWQDKGVAGGFDLIVNASQTSPTYDATGLNGLPTIDFSTSSTAGLSYLNATFGSIIGNSNRSFTMFIVSKYISGTGADYLFMLSGVSVDEFIWLAAPVASSTVEVTFGAQLSQPVQAEAPRILSEPVVLTVAKDDQGNRVTIRENGRVIGVGTFSGGIDLTADCHLNVGYATGTAPQSDMGSAVSEIAVIPSLLSVEQIESVESYLGNKYNIPVL